MVPFNRFVAVFFFVQTKGNVTLLCIDRKRLPVSSKRTSKTQEDKICGRDFENEAALFFFRTTKGDLRHTSNARGRQRQTARGQSTQT